MTSPTDAKPSRVRRPAAQRTEPDRTGWSGDTPSADATGADAAATPEHPEIEQIVSDAVRIGYSVIGDHLKQGRAAADRFSAGVYGVSDVPGELGQLGRRMMDAARDLSGVWFDLLQAAIRDPRLAAALKSQPVAPPPAAAKTQPVSTDVPIACTFPGKPAIVVSAKLTRPEQPSFLTTAGLHTAGGEAPITTVTFLAAPGGGVTAVIRIPPDQPAGTYSGVISDEDTHAPLGMISVRVEQ